MKINFLTKSNSFKKKDFNLSTRLYWKLAMLGGLLIMILSFYFGYNLFMKINKETPLPDSNAGGQSASINIEKLENVLNLFSERENKSLQIINSGAPVVDPSF